MPQMSPMNWLYMYIIFLLYLFLVYLMCYYFLDIVLWDETTTMKLNKKVFFLNKW